MKSATSVLIIFAGPVKVHQFQHFPIQEVCKEIETSNIKILRTTTQRIMKIKTQTQKTSNYHSDTLMFSYATKLSYISTTSI